MLEEDPESRTESGAPPLRLRAAPPTERSDQEALGVRLLMPARGAAPEADQELAGVELREQIVRRISLHQSATAAAAARGAESVRTQPHSATPRGSVVAPTHVRLPL